MSPFHIAFIACSAGFFFGCAFIMAVVEWDAERQISLGTRVSMIACAILIGGLFGRVVVMS